MKHPDWTQADSHEAKQIWDEYQNQHNLSDRIGQTAGIDPKSKRIWFGSSISDIVLQRNTEGLNSPLFFNESVLKPISVKEFVSDLRNRLG